MPLDDRRKATLYRMVMPGHLCPYGLKSRDLLKREGYEIDDRPLRSRAETDAFMEREGVKTTPQTYIDGERIGGFDDLKIHLGKETPGDQTTFAPVIAVFAIAAALAVALRLNTDAPVLASRTAELFIAFAMVLLGLQKLRDLEAFELSFLNYDLLARRWVRYAQVYPFVETGAGLLMIAGVLTAISAPAAAFVGSVGAASVVKAVYIDRRSLSCACVGGGSNVPLGAVSLTENLMMVGMAIWMAVTRLPI